MTNKEKFKRELIIRKYAFNSIETYCGCLATFIQKAGENPSIDQIKDFLSSIPNHNYHKQMVATIRHYYNLVLKTPVDFRDIPYPKKQHKLPDILSVEEMQSLINVPKNLKHQAIIELVYATGIRISEVINLKLSDIESKSENKHIKIRQAKGYKDRIVPLDKSLLNTLKQYYTKYKPTTYLFEGQIKDQYSERSINKMLKYWAKAAGIKKEISCHKLRHSFATHSLESGIDLRYIQAILGHSSTKVTEVYTHVTTKSISRIKSPLSFIK